MFISPYLRTVPPNTKLFLHSMWEKQILVLATGIQKKKMGVEEHFVEIIKDGAY